MEWVTTTTILERLCDFNDRTAWERFHDRFRLPVKNFARHMGLSDATADDVAQETMLAFMEAYRARKYDRSKGRLSSWLFGIAFRQAANARRKGVREHLKEVSCGPDESVLSNIPDENEATAVWDREWVQAAMESGLTQIRKEVTEKTFLAFELVFRAGRNPDAVAAELGMSRDAVYVAKHRVLKRLGELMKAYDHFEDQG